MIAVTGIAVTAVTHQGKIRTNNEDTIGIGRWVRNAPMNEPSDFRFELQEPLLFLVADGMGGHAAGEEASRRVAVALASRAPGALDEATLAEFVVEEHRRLHATMVEQPDLHGMGTTVVGLLVRPDSALYFNVGDSRLYRIRDGFIRQLSVDDVPNRDLSDGSATTLPRSGLLTQCLGGSSAVVTIIPHTGIEPLTPGWLYLLCSDGLSDVVSIDRMESILTAVMSDSDKVRILLDEALKGGGPDNVSLILLRLLGPVTT